MSNNSIVKNFFKPKPKVLNDKQNEKMVNSLMNMSRNQRRMWGKRFGTKIPGIQDVIVKKIDK